MPLYEVMQYPLAEVIPYLERLSEQLEEENKQVSDDANDTASVAHRHRRLLCSALEYYATDLADLRATDGYTFTIEHRVVNDKGQLCVWIYNDSEGMNEKQDEEEVFTFPLAEEWIWINDKGYEKIFSELLAGFR